MIAPFTSYDSFRVRLLGVLAACANEPMEVVVYDHESVAEATSPLLGSLPATGRLDGLLIMGASSCRMRWRLACSNGSFRRCWSTASTRT